MFDVIFGKEKHDSPERMKLLLLPRVRKKTVVWIMLAKGIRCDFLLHSWRKYDAIKVLQVDEL